MNSPTKPNKSYYLAFLDEAKTEIRRVRVNVSRSANREPIQLYWWFGKAITKKQEELGWGKSVVEQLAIDLQKMFNGRSSFSVRNIWNMRKFYLEYHDDEKLQQLVAEFPGGRI